ncbi:MAG: hypothetical protein ABI995_16910, partial [Acidobacteriota bacterium]
HDGVGSSLLVFRELPQRHTLVLVLVPQELRSKLICEGARRSYLLPRFIEVPGGNTAQPASSSMLLREANVKVVDL